MSSLLVATRTDVGEQRERNEDTVTSSRLSGADGRLLVVADGMGGQSAGDIASETAVETFVGYVTDNVDPGLSNAQAVLREGVKRAQRRLESLIEDNPEYEGMGTTLVAALVSPPGEATIVNVGDSRAYLLHDEISQLTVDQNLAGELVAQGDLDREDVASHPYRHVLSQALGTTEEINPTFVEADLGDGVVLLCSDGLTEEVGEEEIRSIVTDASTLNTAAEDLVAAANRNGGSDNISVTLATKQ